MKSLSVSERYGWSALRRPPGLLLARRPRLRVGADAARARPGRRRAGLVAARLGPPHRQDPPRQPASPKTAACNSKLVHDAGPQVPDEYLYKVVDALDESPKRPARPSRRSRSTGCCAPHRLHAHHRRAQRGAAAPEPRRRRLEPHPRADRQARRRQRTSRSPTPTGTSASSAQPMARAYRPSRQRPIEPSPKTAPAKRRNG
jgi:hypothetical protein